MPRQKKLQEYKNVTENELMILEIYGDDLERHLVKVPANESVFLCEKDIRTHVNDKRFIEGKLVLIGSEAEVALTKEAKDIMTPTQIEYFIKNNNDPKEVLARLEKVTSIQTLTRILKEAKRLEQNKSYAFVTAIETKLTDILKEQERLEMQLRENQEKKLEGRG